MPLALICKALIAILLVAFAAPWAHADGGLLPVPVLTGPVIDQTGTLSASDKAALETQLQTLEQTRGAQVVVLMVPTTAPPDIAAARIIDGAMKPRFQQSDYAGGLRDAVTQLSARIAGEALPAPASNSGTAVHSPDTSRDGFDWTDLAIFLFFGVMVAGPVMRSIFGSRLGGLLMGGGVGLLAFVVTSSLIVAGGAGLLALLYTWIFGGTGGGSSRRRGRGGAAVGGWGAGVGGGGWSGGGRRSARGGPGAPRRPPGAPGGGGGCQRAAAQGPDPHRRRSQPALELPAPQRQRARTRPHAVQQIPRVGHRAQQRRLDLPAAARTRDRDRGRPGPCPACGSGRMARCDCADGSPLSPGAVRRGPRTSRRRRVVAPCPALSTPARYARAQRIAGRTGAALDMARAASRAGG